MQKRNFNQVYITFILILVMTILACSSFSSPAVMVTHTPRSISTLAPITATAILILPPVQIFSLDEADRVPPEDILVEIHFSASGGGGGPTECPHYDINSPSEGFNSEHKDPNSPDPKPIKLTVCGWVLGEQANVVIETPNGEIYKETTAAARPFTTYNAYDDRSFAVIDYEYFPVEGQFGKYRFTFTGDSGVVTITFFVPPPNLNMEWDSSGETFYVSGLQPGERVRMLLYKVNSTGMSEGKYIFDSWNEYYADEFGQIQLQDNSDYSEADFRFAVVGDISGWVPGSDLKGVTTINPDGSCVADPWKNEVFPTRLYVGEYAYVAFDPPTSNRLRNGPGRSYDVIDMIKPGVVFEILEGPKCINGVTWWKIKGVDRPFEGWTTEANELYWLVPCSPKNKACP